MPRRCSSQAAERHAQRAAFLALAALVLPLGCTHLSAEREQALGHEFHYALYQEVALIEDPVVQRYVNGIGARLVTAAGLDLGSYRFYVVNHPDRNAFAAPGGYIYLHTGTILAAQNVSELAAVLAHEIGHVAHRDVAENWERRQDAARAQRAGVVAAGLTAGPLGAGAAGLLGGLGGLAVLNSFTRDDEREADAFSVEILQRAGYDPRGLVTFFQTLLRDGDGGVPELLSSHPGTSERVERARNRIAVSDVPAPARSDDGGRLEIIQHRIELLTGERHPLPHR
jgi:predicted Zn-dependent protease